MAMFNRRLELKIAKVERLGWDFLLHPESSAQAAVLVEAAYVKTYKPQPGGTYVLYDNGAEGYTPPGGTVVDPVEDAPVVTGPGGSAPLLAGEEDTSELEP